MGHFTGKRGEHALDMGYGLRKIEIELRKCDAGRDDSDEVLGARS